ncbi:MAG: DUF4410 domain-containing protein [Chthoniobacterales bacterium]
MKPFPRSMGVALAAALLAGCASVGVKEDNWTDQRPTLPTRVYVADYGVPAEVLAVDRGGEELEAFRRSTAENFTGELCERISKRIAPAVPLEKGTRPAKGTWVVEGSFLRVNQGSRLLRSLVGLGAGGTKMEVRTIVSSVGARGVKRKIAEIETTGGSNAEPGLLTVPAPIGGGIRAVVSLANTGVTKDQERTARMITAAMAEKLEAQGHQLSGKKEKAKRLDAVESGEAPESAESL